MSPFFFPSPLCAGDRDPFDVRRRQLSIRARGGHELNNRGASSSFVCALFPQGNEDHTKHHAVRLQVPSLRCTAVFRAGHGH